MINNPLCLGMAPNPEHRRLGSGGSSKCPSMRPASISYLRDSSIIVGYCNAVYSITCKLRSILSNGTAIE